MIRPASEIEFPPSDFLRMKASMLARMEQLSSSSNTLMNVIAERVGAEFASNAAKVDELTAEQDRLIANMRKLARA